jgi:hypothetical protein
MRRLGPLLVLVGCSQPLGNQLPDLAMTGQGAIGTPCSHDSQCLFGVCLDVGLCSHACPLPACELGWTCAPASGRASPVCQPGAMGGCAEGKNHAQYVAAQILLPQSRMEYAVDLNGDGKTDNQYGNIVGALAAQNLNPQNDVDDQVDSGQTLLLVDIRSSDPLLASDGCAGALVTHAVPEISPNFSGSGSFTVDGTVKAGELAGTLESSLFQSTDEVAVSLDVYLPLFSVAPGTPSPKIPISAARLRLDRTSKRGQLNGVIRKQDLDEVNANVAALLDQRVQLDPSSQTSQQILQIFDTGGQGGGGCGQTCQNPNGSCAKANDGRIATCEVTTNPIIQNVLAPDVDMFDAAGNYAPNPANTDRDALSIGFGIRVVGASF